MPVVNIQIVQGLDDSQKRILVDEITSCLARVTGSKPEKTHIIIQEVLDTNWGYEGKLVVDRRVASKQSIR